MLTKTRLKKRDYVDTSQLVEKCSTLHCDWSKDCYATGCCAL